MDETIAPIFTQAKLEYTSQLIDVLTPQIFDGLKSIFDEANTVYRTNTSKSLIVIFRSYLEKVPSWSNMLIETETDRIIQLSRCDWLDDLITAVFISHTKILTAIGSSNDNSNIDLTIPKTVNFVHKCYINIAREIWKNPYLYDESVLGSEYQKNMKTIEEMIKHSIENTIRKLLPVKEILRKHLDTYEINNQDIQKRNETNDIKKMLLEEINNLDIISLLRAKNKGHGEENEGIHEEPEEGPEEEPVEGPEEEPVEGLEEEPVEGPEEEPGEGITPPYNDNINETHSFEEYKENDGYVSPDDEAINEKCKGITINTIDTTEISQEPIYDNVEIMNNSSPEKKYSENDLINTFMESIRKNEEEEKVSGIIKDPDIVKEPEPSKEPMKEPIPEPMKEPIPELVKEPIPELVKEPSKGPVKEPSQELVKEPSQELVKEPSQELVKEPSQELVKEPSQELVKEPSQELVKEPSKGPVKEPSQGPVKEPEPRTKAIGFNNLNENGKKPMTIVKKQENNTGNHIINTQEKELISVDISRDSDDETVDEFFNDMSKMMEQKGITVNKSTRKYTLFDDAIPEE
jgi:hypothetical protein